MERTHLVRHRNDFDPAPYEAELVAIVDAVLDAPDLDAAGLDRILKRHPKDGRGLFSRSEIIAGFRRFAPDRAWDVDARAFVERLRMRPVRTQSGVTPVTVLTKPFPCPGECIFCPNDVRMPKSYLADEPGAQRAADNAFDPYRQTWSRLAAYHHIGHPTDKVELIVLGGTWSAHPEPYQVWFITRCFDALNDFGRGVDGRGDCSDAGDAHFGALPALDGRRLAPGAYNRTIRAALSRRHDGALLAPEEEARWDSLAAAQRRNESAACRNVGIALETRPDHVTAEEVRRMRRLGATKVQIGIQSLSDAVLAANRRGHDVAATRRALARLRGAGFKIHAHWMPNLHGATPAGDIADYGRLFDDPDFRPDEIKIYPCSLVESAALMEHYESGAWRPYTTSELLSVLTASLARTPEYCRVTRVIRDFSSGDIVDGNRIANLREVAEAQLAAAGRACRDIRAREIRGLAVDPASLRLVETRYATGIGAECFLQFATPEGRLAGFLRLSLPRAAAADDELRGRAIIREVHVYGNALEIGRRATDRAQHAGLGRRLIERASEIAAAAGFEAVAVISAVGTRGYYRGLGFHDGALYQHRATRPGERAAAG